jgi:hypothetical protein
VIASGETQMPTVRVAGDGPVPSAAPGVRMPSGLPQDDFHPEVSFFEGLPGPFGERRLELKVAGMTACVEGLSSRQHADMAARYGIFARAEPEKGSGPADLRVRVHRSPRDRFLRVRPGAGPELYRLLMRREGRYLVAWSYEWASRTDFESRVATLAAADGERVVFDRTIENYLRVGFAHLALQRGGFLLHGAAVVRGGRAFVFFGPSGSGKTTVTLLSKGDRVLSDDLVMLVPEGGTFAAASVPFRGLLTPPATSGDRHPIAGLFRLVQDSTDHLEEMGGARAVGEIVQSLPFVTERPEAAPGILEIAGSLARAIPVQRLHFTKSSRFWKVIEDV